MKTLLKSIEKNIYKYAIKFLGKKSGFLITKYDKNT